MGQGSKFCCALSTKGGRSNFITGSDISSGDKLAKEILGEMRKENIKFTKDKIVFVAKLENGNKIFLETSGVEHIVSQHAGQFFKTFGVISKTDISSILVETISKGKLIQSYRHDSNGNEGYRNLYYYKHNYIVVYAIASNGYIETCFPIRYKGGNK